MTYKTTTLDTFVTLQRGYDLPAQDRIPGVIPIIAANGQVGFHDVAKVNAQCVVLGRSGSVGNPQLISEPFWPLNTTLFVKDFHGNSPTFVYYVLKTIDFKSFDAGGTVPTLNRNHLTQIEVPLLDLAHQEAISGVLQNLDAKIAANNALSKTLEDIAQTIFKSWFIDFNPVKAKMAGEKPKGMDAATAKLFPDSMEDSEIGLIPKGWQVKSLFDCGLEIESGSRPKGGVKGITSGVPSIGAESINGLGVFDFSKTKYVPRDFYEKMNKGKPRDFDVLLYKDGGKPGEFKPRVGMYGLGFPFNEFAINEHVFILRAPELGNPYLYFWIRLERTLDVLRSRGIKAAIPGINQQDVGTILTVKPSQEILKSFNQLVFPSISKILTLGTESLMLMTLRDTLMPRLISGELQIPKEMLAS